MSSPVPSPASRLPAVHVVLADPRIAALPRPLAVRVVREVLAWARERILTGGEAPDRDALILRVLSRVEALERPAVRRVINATGVVLHTNLGRAPLGSVVADAVREAALGYSTVEMDMETGGRGDRLTGLRDLLRDLTGAQDGLVVNNNAAAVLLAMTALASGRRVLVSRGELVEIGDSFRIPDVAAAGGAMLAEVGTTNRTRLSDYERALDSQTAGILKVHRSNFRIIGFTEDADRAALAALAASRGLWLMEDLGSGNLVSGLPGEPTVADVVAAGTHLVTFSGDKLLGGPQAGVVVGRADLVQLLRRHPLYRALRVDKLVLAALDATLRLHRRGQGDTLPTLACLAAGLDTLRPRAEALARGIDARGLDIRCETVDGRAGAGSLPEAPLPSVAVAVRGISADRLAGLLRQGQPPVIGRVAQDALLLDPRTLLPGEDEEVVLALNLAIRAIQVAEGTP